MRKLEWILWKGKVREKAKKFELKYYESSVVWSTFVF